MRITSLPSYVVQDKLKWKYTFIEGDQFFFFKKKHPLIIGSITKLLFRCCWYVSVIFSYASTLKKNFIYLFNFFKHQLKKGAKSNNQEANFLRKIYKQFNDYKKL